jgi:hypothetical protein
MSLNSKQFEKAVHIVLKSIGVLTKQSKIPSPKAFLTFAKETFKQKDGQQKGGNRMVEFLVPYAKSILGIVDASEPCAMVETSLNLLCWSAFLYTLIGNEQETIYELMGNLSAPHDYILSLMPYGDVILRETSTGKMTEFAARIYTDYKQVYLHDLGLVGTIMKLWKGNGILYEKLYINPIICMLGKYIVECDEKCKKNKTRKSKTKSRTKSRTKSKTKSRIKSRTKSRTKSRIKSRIKSMRLTR